MLVKPSISMIPHRQIMEIVGFTKISSTFHEFGETSEIKIHQTLNLEASGAIVNERLLSQRCNDQVTQQTLATRRLT